MRALCWRGREGPGVYSTSTGRRLCTLAALILPVSMPPALQAQLECYGSCPSGAVCFPLGYLSFADVVLNTEQPAFCPATGDNYKFPAAALGEPNYSPCDATDASGAYALGLRGVLEVGFTDNLMVNTGSPAADLHVFEVGEVAQDVFIGVRPADDETRMRLAVRFMPDANGYFAVGTFPGGTRSIDLDAWATGFGPGELRFEAVKIIDAPAPGRFCPSNTNTVGADIDAVGAISTVPVEPFRCTGDCGAVDLFGCIADLPSTNPNSTDFGKCAGPSAAFGSLRRLAVHVYARLSGASEGGIFGAENFYLQGWEPFAAVVSVNLPSYAIVAVGSMTSPSNSSRAFTIGFSSCQDSANNFVFLGAVDAIFLADPPPNSYVRVVPGNPVRSPDLNCVLLTVCDFPTLTRICVNGGQFIINPSGLDCTVGVKAESWARIKQLYR